MSAFLRKYATATTINFPLIALGTVNFTSTASLTTADMKLSLNEGVFTTVGTAIVNEGSYGYSYTCTTADLTAARVMMVIISTAATKVCEDTMILIETYGHTNAQHTFDLSIANQTVIASAGTVTLAAAQVVTVGTNNDKTGYSLTQTFPSNFADLTISATTGAVILQPNQNVVASAGTVIIGASGLSAGAIVAGAFSAGAFAASFLSAGGIATGAITSTKFAAGAIDSASIAVGAFTTYAFVAGFLSAGGVAAAALSAGGFAAAFLSAGGIAAGAISAGGIAAGAISAGGIATDAIDADALAADAVTEIWGKAMVAMTGTPAWTASVLSGFSWLFALSKNTITQTSVLQTVLQSDGATTLATSTLSDDATTFTRGSFN